MQEGCASFWTAFFNHCGAFHKWLDREGLYRGKLRGAYRHADSPYHDYFYWNADGTYEGWWGYENHPKLNVEGCAALREELLAIARRWVSPPFDADGWRLDVAADLGKQRNSTMPSGGCSALRSRGFSR